MFHCEEKFLKARSWQIMQDWQIPSMIRTTNAGHILPPRRQVSYQWFRNLLYVFQDGLEAPTLPNWRFYFRNYILRQMKQQLHLGKANTSECRVYYIAGFLSWCHLRIFVERERERKSFKWTYDANTKYTGKDPIFWLQISRIVCVLSVIGLIILLAYVFQDSTRKCPEACSFGAG